MTHNELLKLARKKAGMSQTEFAGYFRMPVKTLRHWEINERKVPDYLLRLMLYKLEMEGLVQRFEYTFELAWKVLQDLLLYKGYEFMLGPNGTMKMAFEDGLITDHDNWRKMAKSRNTLSHVYDEEEAIPIIKLIYSDYAPLLKQLDNVLMSLSQNQDYQQV